MMRLTPEEREWLDTYRRELADQFPGVIEELLIFGSKGQGEAGPESDPDILVILREGDRTIKRQVRHVGHRLAALGDVVPSMRSGNGQQTAWEPGSPAGGMASTQIPCREPTMPSSRGGF